MKALIASLVLLTLAGCASIPQDEAGRRAYYVRVCQGETANQQGVAISQFTKESSGDYVMHECLYKHGVRD